MARALELAWRGWGRVQPNPAGRRGRAGRRGSQSARAGTPSSGSGTRKRRRSRRPATARGARRWSARSSRAPIRASSHRAPRPSSRPGIRRVVAAVADPNPVAAGGAVRLRAAGVEVELGLLVGSSGGAERRLPATELAIRRARSSRSSSPPRSTGASPTPTGIRAGSRATRRGNSCSGCARGSTPSASAASPREPTTPRSPSVARSFLARHRGASCSLPTATCPRRYAWCAPRARRPRRWSSPRRLRRHGCAPLEAAGVNVLRTEGLVEALGAFRAAGHRQLSWSRAGAASPERCSPPASWIATTGSRRRSGSAWRGCRRSPGCPRRRWTTPAAGGSPSAAPLGEDTLLVLDRT